MTSRQSAYDRRRLAQGWRRVPVWLDAVTIQSLDTLRAVWPESSAQELIRVAVRQMAERS